VTFLAFLGILRRAWWAVLLAVAVVLSATIYFISQQPPIYRATTTLVLRPDQRSAEARGVRDGLEMFDRRSIIATYAKIPSSQTVRQRAQQQVGIPANQARDYAVRTVVVPDTNILEVAVEGPDRRVAAELANAIAAETPDYGKQFYGGLQLTVLDVASEPRQPIRPDVLRSLGLGAVLGSLLGIASAFIVEYVRDRKGPAVATGHRLRTVGEDAAAERGPTAVELAARRSGE
jgi:uncharacterized protein involved in exopolysaccharide biosynthesis